MPKYWDGCGGGPDDTGFFAEQARENEREAWKQVDQLRADLARVTAELDETKAALKRALGCA